MMFNIGSLLYAEGGREALYEADVVPLLLKLYVNTNVADTDDVLLMILSTLAADSGKSWKYYLHLVLTVDSIDSSQFTVLTVHSIDSIDSSRY